MPAFGSPELHPALSRAATLPVQAPLDVSADGVRVQLRCGVCQSPVAQLALPPLPLPSTWEWAAMNIGRQVIRIFGRKIGETWKSVLLRYLENDDRDAVYSAVADTLANQGGPAALKCNGCANG